MRRVLFLLVALIAAPAQAAAPVRVVTSVAPAPARFGDIVHATLVVRAAGPATVEQGFAPFSVLSASSTSSTSGGVVTTTWRFALQCLQAQCAPGPGARSVPLAPSHVQVGTQHALARFPAVQTVPRVTAAQVSRPNSSFRHPTALPPPTYRVAPGTARAVLFAAAAVLVLAALALLRPIILPRRTRAAGRETELEPLARALALARASLTRPAPDRRRALGLLSRTLRGRHEPATGQAAADLAWSEPEPDPHSMEALLDQIDEGR